VTVVALSELIKERCMAEENESETMTDEEFAWAVEVKSNPNATAADRRKMIKLFDTKALPEGVFEPFSELANEDTDEGD
jgi:hypothetical protein